MRIILAGGGTGGHIMPGIALAQRIVRETDAQVLFITSDRELDSRIVRRYGFDTLPLTSRSPGLNPARWPHFAADSFKAFKAAWNATQQFTPDAAVGLGGYASFLPIIAAKLQRVPIVLLEQNVIPGRATRRLAGLASELACQWPETIRHCGVKVRARVTGNPIREEILSGRREESVERLHLDPEKKTLLVLGGSQGAHFLNMIMIDAVTQLAKLASDLQVIHLSGHEDREQVARAYQSAGIQAEVIAFLDDIQLAYRAADFAFSRAGGTTIAELTACGIPSILVPYPHAAANHQFHNATALAQSGAAIVIEQSECTVGRLADELARLIRDPGLAKRMRADALGQARVQASDTILDTLRGFIHKLSTPLEVETLSPQTVGKE